MSADLNTITTITRSIHLPKSGTQKVANGSAPLRNASEMDTTGTLKSADADVLTKYAQITTIGSLMTAVVNAIKMELFLAMNLKLGILTAAAAVTALKLPAWLTNSSIQLFVNANASLLAAMKTKAGPGTKPHASALKSLLKKVHATFFLQIITLSIPHAPQKSVVAFTLFMLISATMRVSGLMESLTLISQMNWLTVRLLAISVCKIIMPAMPSHHLISKPQPYH